MIKKSDSETNQFKKVVKDYEKFEFFVHLKIKSDKGVINK